MLDADAERDSDRLVEGEARSRDEDVLSRVSETRYHHLQGSGTAAREHHVLEHTRRRFRVSSACEEFCLFVFATSSHVHKLFKKESA